VLRSWKVYSNKKQRSVVSTDNLNIILVASDQLVIPVHSSFCLFISSCSNIALKCNTKLMNVYNQGRVWNTVHNGRNGLAWIAEAPTMVIGIDLSHGKLILLFEVS
jgi:hypothetical protein